MLLHNILGHAPYLIASAQFTIEVLILMSGILCCQVERMNVITPCKLSTIIMVLLDITDYLSFTQHALMERFALREEAHSMRDELRFVATSNGAQFVIICGVVLMQQLFADTWDILDLV